MKWVKRILAGVVILVLLFVIAAVVFVATFDPNDYKQRIEATVEKSTGRELTLQGDIELSVFPWLGVKLGAASLGNAKGFGDQPFAHVNNVEVRVALLPLFRGEVQADTVRLEGVEANLNKNEKGETNWDDLVKGAGEPAPREAPEQPGREVVLEVGGVEIANAAVHWQDAQAGQDVRIAPIDLTTSAIVFGEPFDIDLAVHLANAKPAIETDLKLTGEATINPETQRYALADLQVTVNAKGEALPVTDVEASLQEAAVDAATQRYTLAGLELTVSAKGGGLPKEGIEATLATAINADLEAGTASVQPLTLEAAGMRLAGQVNATNLNSKPQIQGELASDAFSPRKLLSTLGQQLPPAQDPKVLENATVKLAFNATPDSAKLSRLEARLDDTHLTGHAAMQSFEKPKIAFDLGLDAIDLDRYMAPEAETEPAPTGKPTDDSLGLPVETLRDLDLDGRLAAGKLKASGMNFTDLKATITARDGVVKVNPLTMNLYQGSLKGFATLDAQGDTPKFTLNSLLDGVQAGTLLTELAGDDYLTGATRLALNVNTQGQKISDLTQQLNGNFNVSFKEGSIANSELAGRIARVIAFFKGQPDAPAQQETRFTSLTGTGNITNGVLANNNLALIAPQILAKGQGKVNIPQSSVAYTLNVALNDQGKPKDNRFVPIEIGGALSDLNYKLALTDVIKDEAKQELKEKEQELKDDLQEKLGDELQDLKDKFSF